MGAGIGQEIALPLEAQAEGRGDDRMSRHRHVVQRIVETEWKAYDKQRGTDFDLSRRDTMSSPSHFSLLVVDDEPVIRQVISSAILRAGHNVETAESGEQAYARLMKGDVDIALRIQLDDPQEQASRGLFLGEGSPLLLRNIPVRVDP